MTSTKNLMTTRRGRQLPTENIFVNRDEFCKLMLSYRKLVRADEPGNRVRGLLDIESGERYLIEQEELVGRA
jgi:hypothetical protein